MQRSTNYIHTIFRKITQKAAATSKEEMISFNQTFDESRAIRVLVVPIGENSLYSKHFEIVSRTRSLPVFDLNRPSDWKTQNTLLKNFNWNSPSSNIQFEYLRYDRAASGPVDMDSFQCSRRILVVIGVINYPELDATSSSRLEQDMDYYSRRHPHVVLRRYFVFNYFAAVAQLPPGSNPPLPQLPQYDSVTKDPYAMVIFPPDGECEGGSMIDVHTKEIMGNVAVRILQAIENWLIGCEEVRLKLQSTSAYSTSPLALPTWLPLKLSNDDLEEGLGSTTTEITRRMRRRAPGRVQKWMGDLCMQVCSPLDAWDHYNLAISDCRNQNDTVWLANSLEGSVGAMLAMYRIGGSMADEISVLVKDIKLLLANVSGMTVLNALIRVCEDRCVEAMNLYTKNLVYCGLEVECALRLAKMHEQLTPSPDKQQKVMDFVFRAAAVPGLSVAQQIECTLEGALACLRVGLNRKYAFLLYVAALLSADSENSYVPHSLVQAASRQYGVNLQEDGSLIVENPDNSWAGMRRMLLAHGAHFAKEHKDNVSIARYLATLLRLMGEMEANRSKNKKYWIGETFLDDNPAIDDQDRVAMHGLGFQSNYSPWDPETSRAVKFRETLNGIVLLPSKLLGADQKIDDSSHSAPGDNNVPITRNLSSSAVSQFVESATGGITAAVRAVGVNRTNSVHGTAPSFHLGMMRGTLPIITSLDPSANDDREDSQSESSEHRFTSELLTNSSGNIAVPKIPPFVQNLVSKKKKYGRSNSTSGAATAVAPPPPVNDVVPPQTRANAAPEIPNNAAPPPSPDVNAIKQQNAPQFTPPPLLPAASRPSILGSTAPPPPLYVPVVLDPSLRLAVPIDSQTQSLQTLMTVCTELPTATSLLLDGLPYVISVTPLSPPEEESPLPVKVSLDSKTTIEEIAPGTTKALFYDPFEAKRAKHRVKSNTIYWSNEKIAQIEAIFCNPLAIPVTLHDVHILIEGVHHSCFYAKSVVIPPDAQEFKSTFLICPRQAGVVKIIGVRFSIFNAIYTSKIDQNTLKGQPALPRELSLPKKYPRSVSREPSKIPTPYTKIEEESEHIPQPGKEKEKEKEEKSPISEIMVVPESASLSLCTSWGPNLAQTQFEENHSYEEKENHVKNNSSSFASQLHHPPHLPWFDGRGPLTTTNSLKLTLYQREHRREMIRLENLSPLLKIEDFQISVHCILSSPDAKDKKVCYALLPFSRLRLSSSVFVPPILSDAYFAVQSEKIDDPPLPFLIRLLNLERHQNQCLSPQQHRLFELEFVNFSGSLDNSITYEMRIEIDYVSTFPGVEKYISDHTMEAGSPNLEETIYIRKSFIATTVTLTPDIGISSCVSLVDNHLSIESSNYLVSRLEIPSWIQAPSDIPILQGILSHFNKAYQEQKTTNTFNSHNQNDLFSYSLNRQFSIQVDNSSPYVISLSHIPFQQYYDSSPSSTMWTYFYPHESTGQDSLTEEMTIKHLLPHSSANIILSITDQQLWDWFHRHCLPDPHNNGHRRHHSLQESIEILLQTIKLYWLIHIPPSHSSKLFNQHNNNEFFRTGMISFQNMNSKLIYKDLLLPLLTFQFNSPAPPPTPATSTPTPTPAGLNYLLLSSSKIHLPVRKFHQISTTINYSVPLLLSYFKQIAIEQIIKIEMESIFFLLCNDDDEDIGSSGSSGGVFNKENSSSTNPNLNIHVTNPHPLQAKNCIITGNPHQIIPIEFTPSSSSSSLNSLDQYSIQHDLSCCFTRCGGYKIYTVARLLLEYLPHSSSSPSSSPSLSSQESTILSSSWWIPQQPSLIIAT